MEYMRLRMNQLNAELSAMSRILAEVSPLSAIFVRLRQIHLGNDFGYSLERSLKRTPAQWPSMRW